MPTHAGALPSAMQELYSGLPVKKGAKSTGSVISNGAQWTLSAGWHQKRPKGWVKGLRRERRQLVDLNGNAVYVPYYTTHDVVGYEERRDGTKKPVYKAFNDDTVPFRASSNEKSEEYNKRMALAEAAFEASGGPKDNIYVAESKSGGHIEKLEYAKKEQILRVTFANGSVCVFFKVREAVAGVLIHLMKNDIKRTTRKGVQHMVGVRFWTYIRKPGSHYGAVYPFEYENKSKGVITSKSRHVVRLSGDSSFLQTVLGSNTKAARELQARILAATHGDASKLSSLRYEIALPDAEWSNLADEILGEVAAESARQNSATAISGKTVLQGSEDKGDLEHTFVSDRYNKYSPDALAESGYYDRKTETIPTGPEAIDYAQTFSDFANIDARSKLENKLRNMLSSETFNEAVAQRAFMLATERDFDYAGDLRDEVLHKAETQEFASRAAIAKQLGDTSLSRLAGVTRQNTGVGSRDLHVMEGTNFDEKAKLVRAAYGPGALRNWFNNNLPARYAMQYAGRYWTISDLKEFANVSNDKAGHCIKPEDRSAYEVYLKARDWRGALNFLKSKKTTLYYKNESGNTVPLEDVSYAGQNDKVIDDSGRVL